METTADDKQRLQTIILRLIEGCNDWLGEQAIEVGEIGPFWILNYRPSPRTPYSRLVRGMVVEKPPAGWNDDPLALIRSFPFIRFFNQGEPDADPVDFSRSEMLEKLDGTMIGVFFPTGDPRSLRCHTRKSLFVEGFERQFAGNLRLLKIVEQHAREFSFSADDAQFTFVFEFIHSASQVRTRYRDDQFGLYLIGARRLDSHRELTETELDAAADRIGAPRPRRWDALISREDILAFIRELSRETPDFEGFVFRDRQTGARVKLKDPEYVKSLHLAGVIGYARLIPRVLEGEEQEILAYIPEAEDRIAKIRTRYAEYLSQAAETVISWRDRQLDRKQLAMQVFRESGEPDPFLRQMIMSLYQEGDDDRIRRQLEESLRNLALGDGCRPGNPRKLAQLLQLDEFAPAGEDG